MEILGENTETDGGFKRKLGSKQLAMCRKYWADERAVGTRQANAQSHFGLKQMPPSLPQESAKRDRLAIFALVEQHIRN
jgi:hypothetical protein